MTPKPSVQSQDNSGIEAGLPSMDEAQPWIDPRQNKLPDMASLKPWTSEDDRNLPSMDQATPWQDPKPTPMPGPATPDDDPGPHGWMEVAKSAFGRKMAERAANDATGGQLLLPQGVGGLTFEQQYQKALATPEHKDYTDKLLGQGIGEGWTNPHWWTAQLAGGIGGVTPGLGAAGVASLTPAGPIGGIAAFAGEAALGNLVPAYNAARTQGLDPDKALHRAIIDSGISSAFAVAMGMAGKLNVTSKIAPYMSESIASALERPAAEALAQLGIVQPGLMAAQDIATSGSHGEMPSGDQLLTDMAVGGLAGLGIHEVFKTGERISRAREAREEPATPSATEEVIQEAAAAQASRPGFERLRAGTEPAAPVAVPGPSTPDQPDIPADNRYYEKDLTPQTRKDGRPAFAGAEPDNFFSQLSRAVEEMPANMPSRDVIPYLKKRGVKDAELADAFLPAYLADVGGKANKEDMQAWIESNRVQVWERLLSDPAQDPMAQANELYDHYSETFGSKNQAQWSPRARRHMEQVFREGQLAAAEAQKTSPQYRNQALSGLRDNPEEVTFRTPGPQYSDEQLTRAAQEALKAPAGWGGPEVGTRDWNKLSPEQQNTLKEQAGQQLAQADPDVFTGSHYSDPNTFGHMRYNIVKDRDGHWTMLMSELQSDAHQKGAKLGYRSEGGKIPDLPFKSNVQELMIKRAIQLAAQRGVTRLGWYNGDQVGMRLENKEQLSGARMNYDNKIPGIFKKQARLLGETVGETNFDRPEDPYEQMRPGPFVDQLKAVHEGMGLDQSKVKGAMMYMSISPRLAEHLARHGQAFYDADPQVKSHPAKGTKTLSDYVETNPTPEHLVKPMAQVGDAINRIANQLGITRGIEFEKETNPNAKYRGFLASGVNPATGNYQIKVNLSRLMTRNDLYASMSHEFGHVIKENLFSREKPSTKAAIYAAHDAWRNAQAAPDRLVGDARRTRDNANSLMTGARAMHDHYKISDLVPNSKNYFLSFDEWFSEQTAKWMQTDERPLGIVDKFFKSLGNAIRKMVAKFRQMKTGGAENPDAAVREWLNSKFGAPTDWIEGHKQQFDMDTTKKAADAFDREGAPETRAVPMQGSSAGGRNIIDNLPPDVRGNGEAMAGHADRMNLFYKYFLSLPQLQQLNKGNRQLGLYTSMHRNANVEKNAIMGDAHRRLEQWSRLTDPKQQFALTNFIQDYAHMDHRPDVGEFRDLVNQHKLSDQSVRLFKGVVQDFDGFLEKYRNLLINDAQRIKDPARRANNMQNINTRMDELLRRPFMPITHFGKYSVTVFDQAGNIRHYEQTNSLKRQAQIAKALSESKDMLPGDKVLPGMVAKDVTPFLGMPPGMIDLIGDKLSLSATQRGALDQLRFDYAPAQTFKHQFRNLDLVQGYSTDFMRGYAHFFFHGANHVTRIKWVDAMRDQIRSLGSQQERLARIGNKGGANKVDQIVKYMQAHFEAWVDPKSDWATLRGLMFHQYLGMSPVAAANNLTQTALSTYPWLASRWGDLASMRSLAKASTDLNNFYKKGTMQDMARDAPPGPRGAWQRAAGESVNEGVISETQGHQLAAVSEDRNLLRAFGKKGEKTWLKFSEASSWMFDLSEQYNRRVAFRAAWDMAMRAAPDHKAIKEAIAQDPILYQRLVDTEAKGGKNWSKQEAGAFMAAKHAVETTQFEYQPFARAPIFRGKLGNVLIFKQFTQNMLFNLASNPGMLARWMVIMGALGGVGGMAGYENVNSVIKTIAARLFGKDFDLDDEVRHFAHDVLNDGIQPDVLLHGMSVKGFGIPHVMHSIGANWFPTVDMSKSIGMGDVLGFDPMKLTQLAPSPHPREEELRQLGRASGAAFQLPFSLFDFASSNANFTDLKKYEPLLPHWAGAISHAFRWAHEGRETNAAGNTVVRFNPADTEHMSEILARGLGFQPRRLTEEWERTQALKESSDFWDMRHQILVRQYGDAIKNDDNESADRVAQAIQQYNDQLPDEAAGKAITGKALKASVRQRMGIAEKQEEGIPAQKSNIPLLEKMEPYYPRGWPRGLVGSRPVE